METSTGASITMRRRVAWHETDAAGHNHFSAAFRWMEEAEHQLYRCLGFDPSMIDRVPRVHIDVDYRDRLYYDQPIEVRVGVEKVGTSSCTFAFDVRTEAGGVAIVGRYVIVHAASTTEGSAPWPDDLRSGLTAPRHFAVAWAVE